MPSLFLSYDYKTDEYWRVRFDDVFGDAYEIKLVQPGQLKPGDGAGYVKRLIDQQVLTPEDVVVVLLGPKTYSISKVDWDIAAALERKGMRPSGLLAIRLPTHEDHGKKTINPKRLPARLVDNIKSGYVKIYDWSETDTTMQTRYYQALKDTREKRTFIKNNRKLMEQDMFR